MMRVALGELMELWPFWAHMPVPMTHDLDVWDQHRDHLRGWCQAHLQESSWFLHDSYVTNRLILFTSSLDDLTWARMVLA